MAAESLLGVPIRSLSATLALMLKLAMTPPATLPTVRFPVTVASRVPVRSIVNAGASSGVSAWKPRIVKPLTLTSFTRLLTSKVSRFTSPKTQIASGPKALEQGESALAGASITRVVSAQLDPVLADHHVLFVDAADHDRVARIGGIDSLLDGLAWPNYRAFRGGGSRPLAASPARYAKPRVGVS